MSLERFGAAFLLVIGLVVGILAALNAETIEDALVRLTIFIFIGLVFSLSFEIRHRRVQSLHRKVHRLREEHPRETQAILRKWWMRPFARFLSD